MAPWLLYRLVYTCSEAIDWRAPRACPGIPTLVLLPRRVRARIYIALVRLHHAVHTDRHCALSSLEHSA